MITVKEFCAEQQLSLQGVYAKIKRNGEKLNGHITKSGGVYVLDDFAADFLKRRPADYPLLEKCRKLQNECDSYVKRFGEVTELKNEFAEEKSKNAELEKQIAEIMAEKDKFAQISLNISEENMTLSDTVKKLENDKSALYEKVSDLKNQVAELSEKNDNLKNAVSERDGKIAELENQISALTSSAEKSEKKKFGIFG